MRLKRIFTAVALLAVAPAAMDAGVFSEDYDKLLDPSPIANITLDGQPLANARVVGLSESSVRVEGKSGNGSETWVEVPLEEARKRWVLESRFRKALAAMEQQRAERESERAEKARAEAARIAAGIFTVSGNVVSVLPDGVLMMDGNAVIKLLTKKNLADGENVRASARKTGAVFEYTTALGANATVRVWEEVTDL